MTDQSKSRNSGLPYPDAPERIYIQHDPENTGDPFGEAHEVTWCKDRINDSDIEYVRSEIAAVRSEQQRIPEQFVQMKRALEQCVRVVQMWHGDDAFDIYFNHSPEMKLVRDALGKMADPTEQQCERDS